MKASSVPLQVIPGCFRRATSAGLSFCPALRSDAAMEEALERMIRRALADARQHLAVV